MNFRRQPFQFSTIDPVKCQAELQKRFGLPNTNSDMFVDFLNPGVMGSGIRESSSLGGSPRLQHRVPVFTEKAKGDSEQNNVDSSHKPKVRVIPIQVEGVDGGKRHRAFSGPANIKNGDSDIYQEKLPETFPILNSIKVDDRPKRLNQPKVCNIPIQIEPREGKSNVETIKSDVDIKSNIDPSSSTPEPAKKSKAESNGCAASSDKKEELGIKSIPLKQIDAVLGKLKLYTEEVEKFSGTSKDKQYRYLDEMLTRCMLDLDNVETMGLNDIRKARKEAVRQVQHYVDLLDTKVNESMGKMDSDTSSVDNPEQMFCDIPADANNAANSDLNCNESKDLTNNCASSDVEMRSDPLTELNSELSGDNEAVNVTNNNITDDVDMVEEKVEHKVIDKLSAQDSSMKNEELENTAEADSSSNQETDIKTMSCNAKDSEIDYKNKSDIVIEELDSSLESDCNAIDENISCVVTDSPELDVRGTIVEESESEVMIEEVEDVDEKVVNHSSDICDSSVDTDLKLSFEQINSDISDVTDNCVPMSQENEIVSEKL